MNSCSLLPPLLLMIKFLPTQPCVKIDLCCCEAVFGQLGKAAREKVDNEVFLLALEGCDA